jgi:hypothetical protein
MATTLDGQRRGCHSLRADVTHPDINAAACASLLVCIVTHPQHLQPPGQQDAFFALAGQRLVAWCAECAGGGAAAGDDTIAVRDITHNLLTP